MAGMVADTADTHRVMVGTAAVTVRSIAAGTAAAEEFISTSVASIWTSAIRTAAGTTAAIDRILVTTMDTVDITAAARTTIEAATDTDTGIGDITGSPLQALLNKC